MYVRMSRLCMRIFCPDSSPEFSPQSNPQSIPDRVQSPAFTYTPYQRGGGYLGLKPPKSSIATIVQDA